MSVLEAVASGSRRGVLEAQLEVLARGLDEAPAEVKAGLSRELRLVLKEIEGIPKGADAPNLEDALAARRKAKQAANG